MKRFNLTLDAFGETVFNGSAGSVKLSAALDYGLEPAPVTPTDSAAYTLLSGTIRSTYNAHRASKDREEVVIAPGIGTGNTGMSLNTL